MHVSNTETVSSTTVEAVLRLGDAWRGRDFVVRLHGQNLTWRVVVEGACGREVVASGAIPAGTPALVRVAGIPAVLGGTILSIEAGLTAATGSTPIRTEVAYQPMEPGVRLTYAGSDR